ncbi:MAG: hypothetical protein ACTSQA_00805 [Candidatus Heimdallarchaeaceae archaeon]
MMQEKHYPIIRTIYLYIFALVGLIIVITGSIRAFTMGLEVFIFKDIDKQEQLNYTRPNSLPYVEGLKEVKDDEGFTEDERAAIRSWLADYEEWKIESDSFDHVSARRQQETASILASVMVGLPLYFYHWNLIKKETSERKKNTTENQIS